jgi:hypothetical protein
MSKFNGPATISQITKCVKNNKHNVKINLNVISKFEQGTEFPIYREPKKVEIETSIASKSVNEDKTSLIYNYNQIINIPKKLNEGFDGKLDLNYYIYGVPKNDSFFHSLLYVVSKDFKLKKEDVRLDYVTILKQTMLDKLPKLFRDNKYSKYDYKRTQISDNFEDTSIISEGLMCLASDYFGINLIILNYDTDKYWLGKEYDETLNEKNVVLVYSNGVYFPVIHIYGEFPNNFIYKCVLNRFKIYRKLATNTELSVVEQETVKTVPVESEVQEPVCPKPGSPVLAETPPDTVANKPELRGFSGYKLPELRELATQFGIELQIVDTDTNKSKPKTKKQLYDELSAM